MKKLFSIITLLAIVGTTFCQLPVASKIKTGYTVGEGNYVTTNPSLTDTLKSGDTLFYVVEVAHAHIVYPYINEQWKLVTADTGFTCTYWQSNTGFTSAATAQSRGYVNMEWKQLNSGTTPSAYSRATTTANTTTASPSTTSNEVDFLQNIIWFQGRYLGIRYIAKTKTNFKSIPQNVIKIPSY